MVLRVDRAQIARFCEFVLLQGLSRFLSLLQGLVVIHLLSKWDYGLYALLLAVVMATANIAICGVGMFVSAVGGRFVHDPARIASIFAAGRSVQRWLVLAGTLIVGVLLPIQYHSMSLEGFTTNACLTVLALIMMVLHARGTLCREILSITLHLRANQLLDLASSASRLALIGLLYLGGYLNLITLIALSLMISAINVAVQERLIRRWVFSGAMDTASPEERAEARRVILPQLPNAAYNSIQDQVPYLLMSFIGTVQHVADFAAIGRLGLIFAFLFDILSNYFMPRVGRCQDPARLGGLILTILSGYYLVIMTALTCAYFLREQLVWLLGQKYSHVASEIPLMLLLLGVQSISGSLFVINSARAWMGHSWVFILSTVASQILVIPFLQLDTLHGMLLFALTPNLPFIAINVLFLLRGLRRTTHDLKAHLVS